MNFIIKISSKCGQGGSQNPNIINGNPNVEASFFEIYFCFLSPSLRLRKDIRTLFANHSVCNAVTTTPAQATPAAAAAADELVLKRAPSVPSSTAAAGATLQSSPAKRRELLCEYKSQSY